MLAVARLLIAARHSPGTRPGDITGRLGFPYPSRPHPLEPLHACLAWSADITDDEEKRSRTRKMPS